MSKDKDIEVVIADAHEWLCRQKDGSVDLVTAFHFIEHIPFNALVAMLKEVLRVLRPGGKGHPGDAQSGKPHRWRLQVLVRSHPYPAAASRNSSGA